MRRHEPPAMGRTLPTLRRAWPKDGPLAAICVQSVDVQCVLQFTLIHAAGCVLHRRTSRVIHRLKLYLSYHCSRGQAAGPRQLRRAGRTTQQPSMIGNTKRKCKDMGTKKSRGRLTALRSRKSLNLRRAARIPADESLTGGRQ